MSLVRAPMCAFGRHRPIRSKVGWDGQHYIGHCRDCGAPIYRVKHKVWRSRPVDEELEA